MHSRLAKGLAIVALAMLQAAQSAAAETYVVDAQAGPVFLTKSKSKAIGHAVQGDARLGLRLHLTDRLEVGGAVSGLINSSAHYRVLGLLAHGRFALLQKPVFSLGVGAALGVGNDADILHSDLAAGGQVLPYGFLALDARWTVARRWLLGVEAGWENLSMWRLGLVFGHRFGAAGDGR